jgi:hypothetical protein
MSKILIAIPTCYSTHYTGLKPASEDGITNRSAYLRAHLKDTPNCDVRYFLGGGLLGGWDRDRDAADDVVLPVCDDYAHLPHKVRAMFGYALDHHYDYCMKLDDDSLVDLPRFLASNFHEYDYVGHALLGLTADHETPYASGAGYCLSRHAMSVVRVMGIDDTFEDKQVGFALLQAGIGLHHDARYCVCLCEICKPLIADDWIVVHGGQGRL